MDAFDADVLIYAGIPNHPFGRRVVSLFPSGPVRNTARRAGVGSVLLVPELLSKPLRDEDAATVTTLSGFLARLDLRPVDRAIAAQAAVLGARYKLRAADATHLATAVSMGAHRFITNNKNDFDPSIKEIDITFPADLPDPG
jgi:predicted nucleic acid-binding protein